MDNVSQKLREKLEARRAAEQVAASPSAVPPTQQPPHAFMDDIPDLGDTSLKISPEEQVLDDFIKHMGIVEAYNHYANKGFVDPKGRTESIKVRCPNPAHPDRNPSAWLNTEKNVFNCAQCGGGDVWEIAAWAKGLPVPGYKKQPETFRWLREQIGADFGIYVGKDSGGDPYVTVDPNKAPPSLRALAPPAPVQYVPPGQPGQKPGQPVGQPEQPPGTVTYLPTGAEFEEEQLEKQLTDGRLFPAIPWRDIVPTETFLHEYISACAKDDCPEEFHFWSGLVALGFAVGRMRTLEDSPLVIPNLYVCYTGSTGTGKSKAKRHLINLIKDHLLYKKDDQPPFGTHYLSGVQSAEYVVSAFVHPMMDPTGKIIGYFPKRCCIEFDELAELIGKGQRQGSTLKELLMTLYDGPRDIASRSKTGGDVVAEYPFGGVITTTQYQSIRDLIKKSDNASGFANRWVYATGPTKTQFAVNRVSVDLTRAGGLLRLINVNARAPEVITWSPDAEEVWTKFFYGTIIPYRTGNEASSITQRIDLLLKKLFLLFTINARENVVTKQTVESVLSLYDHLVETYQIIDDQIQATQEGDEYDLLMRTMERLTANGHVVSIRDLKRVIKKRIPDYRLLRMIETQVKLGTFEEAKLPPGPQGGRPKTVWRVTPGVAVGGYSVS
jgi:hypothetical protein